MNLSRGTAVTIQVYNGIQIVRALAMEGGYQTISQLPRELCHFPV